MGVVGEAATIKENDNYDLVYLKNNEAFVLIPLYVEVDLIHRTRDGKNAKQIRGSWFDAELSNLKVGDFEMVD